MSNITLLSDEDYSDIAFGDHPDYETVVEESIIENSRWDYLNEMIVKHKSSDTFWQLNWRSPATEQQETDPDYSMIKVKPVEKTVVVYVVDN